MEKIESTYNKHKEGYEQIESTYNKYKECYKLNEEDRVNMQ